MKIDEMRFRGAIHMHTQRTLAKKIGLSQPAFNRKLKTLDNLRFREFYAICEAMGEKPEMFIIVEAEKERFA